MDRRPLGESTGGARSAGRNPSRIADDMAAYQATPTAADAAALGGSPFRFVVGRGSPAIARTIPGAYATLDFGALGQFPVTPSFDHNSHSHSPCDPRIRSIARVNSAASFVSDPEKYAWAGRDGMTVRKSRRTRWCVPCTMELGDPRDQEGLVGISPNPGPRAISRAPIWSNAITLDIRE